jgi:hypothetical protein
MTGSYLTAFNEDTDFSWDDFISIFDQVTIGYSDTTGYVSVLDNGISTNKIQDNSVTDVKIVSVSGSKITGPIPTITSTTIKTDNILVGASRVSSTPASDIHAQSLTSVELWLESDTDNITETDVPIIRLTQDGSNYMAIMGTDSNNRFSINTYRTVGNGSMPISFYTGGTNTTSGAGIKPNITVAASERFNITDNNCNVLQATQSTSTTTGALTVAGGVGIIKDVYVAGITNLKDMNVANIYPLSDNVYDIGSFSKAFGGLFVKRQGLFGGYTGTNSSLDYFPLCISGYDNGFTETCLIAFSAYNHNDAKWILKLMNNTTLSFAEVGVANNRFNIFPGGDVEINGNGTDQGYKFYVNGTSKVTGTLQSDGGLLSDTLISKSANTDLTLSGNGTGNVIINDDLKLDNIYPITDNTYDIGSFSKAFGGLFVKRQCLFGGYTATHSSLNNFPLCISGHDNGFSETALIALSAYNHNDAKWMLKMMNHTTLSFAEVGVANNRFNIFPGGDVEINGNGTDQGYKFYVNGTSKIIGTLQSDGGLISDTLTSKSANTDLTLSGNGTGKVTVNDDLSVTGGLTSTGSVTSSTEQTDYQSFISPTSVFCQPASNWTLLRAGNGIIRLDHTVTSETIVINIPITNEMRSTASKGFKLTSFQIVYYVSIQALSGTSVYLFDVGYINNNIVSSISVGTSGSLPTATNGLNIYNSTITVTSPSYLNTINHSYDIEVSMTCQASTVLQIYGCFLNFSRNLL